jgi:hypothetical protein
MSPAVELGRVLLVVWVHRNATVTQALVFDKITEFQGTIIRIFNLENLPAA